jgi:PKD domain
VRSALVFAIAALALALPSAGSAAPPSNDDFANATAVGSLPFSESVDLSEATLENLEPGGNCWPLGGSAWYKLEPTQTTRLQITSSASFNRVVNIYRQNGAGLGGLSFVACGYEGNATPELQGGGTYYVQIARTSWTGGGTLDLTLAVIPPPSNDDFANAATIGSVPYSDSESSLAGTREPGEPVASCGPAGNSHWYAFTAPSDGSFTLRTFSGTWPVVGLYRGSSLGSLSEVECRSGNGASLTFGTTAGQVTYIQVADVYSGNYGPITTTVENAPAPVASFWWWPGDPSAYDLVSFSDNSYDPGGNAIASKRYEFGDGSSANGCCPQHRYLADGEYTVALTITTSDGRTASSERTIQVRTHDIAITKLNVPQSAAADQSRELSIALKNTRYAESVTVAFYRSRVGGGWDQVGMQMQTVPARSGNRTTTFAVLYTFTADDKAVGKVTFKAVATINGARDALPADNEVVALPTKVN